MKNYVITLFVLVVITLLLGHDLLPFKKEMFLFHDKTQVARIASFADNIREGYIPPRVAGDYSFGLGYPLFNFYSPAAYWITGAFVLLSVYPITALKLSFLASILVSFGAMLYWLRKRFSYTASLLGAIAYITSPYVAVEIFVRGSLGEMWFLALFPLGLLALDNIKSNKTYKSFFIAAIVLSLVFTVHNVMSLLAVAIYLVYAFFHKIKKGFLAIGFGLLLGAYFLIPAVVEMSGTYAYEMASKTVYSDHFLCTWQIWTSRLWGFGGSAPGCDADGYSFKLGKLHIMLAGMGLGVYLLSLRKSLKKGFKSVNKEPILIAVFGLGSLFLTTYYSLFIWSWFEGVLKVFQFPWRFLIFGVISIPFFIAYGADRLKKFPLYLLGVVFLMGLLLSTSDQYFKREGIPYQEYAHQYYSEDFTRNHIVFLIPEYLPRSANLKHWLSYHSGVGTPEYLDGVVDIQDEGDASNIVYEPLERKFTTDSRDFFINIHYAPYWDIAIDNNSYVPSSFDDFGRPKVSLPEGQHTVEVLYKQTPLQVASNIITMVTLVVLLVGFTPYGQPITKKK